MCGDARTKSSVHLVIIPKSQRTLRIDFELWSSLNEFHDAPFEEFDFEFEIWWLEECEFDLNFLRVENLICLMCGNALSSCIC